MPMKAEREYRSLLTPLLASQQTTSKRFDSECYVEGYATGFEAYPLYECDGVTIYERFERGCFDGCDMSDIIMQYDHEGRVYARNSNNTLAVDVDDNGLFIAADLSRTSGARSLYEDINAGMITKMSWCFVPDVPEFDDKTNTIIHRHIKKIYDVSAVSIPANQNTAINARSADLAMRLGGATEAALKEFERLKNQRRRILIKTLTL